MEGRRCESMAPLLKTPGSKVRILEERREGLQRLYQSYVQDRTVVDTLVMFSVDDLIRVPKQGFPTVLLMLDTGDVLCINPDNADPDSLIRLEDQEVIAGIIFQLLAVRRGASLNRKLDFYRRAQSLVADG